MSNNSSLRMFDEKKEYFEAGRGTKGRDGREGWMDGCKGLIYICACIRGIDLVMPVREQRDKKTEIRLSFYITCNSSSPHLDNP